MMMPFLSKTTGQRSVEHTPDIPKCRLAKRNRRGVNRGRTAGLLHNQRGDITIYTCFFIVAAVMLVSFLLLYAFIRITCINIRNGAKMELNNLSASIYADTFRSQRETNFSEYLNTLYTSSDYVLSSILLTASWNMSSPVTHNFTSACSDGSTRQAPGILS